MPNETIIMHNQQMDAIFEAWNTLNPTNANSIGLTNILAVGAFTKISEVKMPHTLSETNHHYDDINLNNQLYFQTILQYLKGVLLDHFKRHL